MRVLLPSLVLLSARGSTMALRPFLLLLPLLAAALLITQAQGEGRGALLPGPAGMGQGVWDSGAGW